MSPLLAFNLKELLLRLLMWLLRELLDQFDGEGMKEG